MRENLSRDREDTLWSFGRDEVDLKGVRESTKLGDSGGIAHLMDDETKVRTAAGLDTVSRQDLRRLFVNRDIEVIRVPQFNTVQQGRWSGASPFKLAD